MPEAAPAPMKSGGRQGRTKDPFKDKEKPAAVRLSNINAAKGTEQNAGIFFTGFFIDRSFIFLAVSSAIRTSLGPKGMDKMVSRFVVRKIV